MRLEALHRQERHVTAPRNGSDEPGNPFFGAWFEDAGKRLNVLFDAHPVSSASYKGGGAFAVDEARVILRFADARPSLLRVPDRLVVRDLDPVLGAVDPRPPLVRFRIHPRRRRLLGRAPGIPTFRRRRRGPHAPETDDHPERAVPLRGNPGLRPQRDLLGLRRREHRLVPRCGVLDRDLRVPVRDVARGGPRDGVPAVHRPRHDDPTPFECGGAPPPRPGRPGGGGPGCYLPVWAPPSIPGSLVAGDLPPARRRMRPPR